MIVIHDLKDVFSKHTVQCRQCTFNVSGFYLSTTVTSKQRDIKSGFFNHITDSSTL